MFALKKYPRIVELPDKNMAVVRMPCDPTCEERLTALGSLRGKVYNLNSSFFHRYWTSRDTYVRYICDRATNEVLEMEWGIPISREIEYTPDARDSVVAAYDHRSPIEIKTWKYGTVAEILHVGALSDADESANCLREFIEKNDHVITGCREDQYTWGRIPILRDDFRTVFGTRINFRIIIRYPVARR